MSKRLAGCAPTRPDLTDLLHRRPGIRPGFGPHHCQGVHCL